MTPAVTATPWRRTAGSDRPGALQQQQQRQQEEEEQDEQQQQEEVEEEEAAAKMVLWQLPQVGAQTSAHREALVTSHAVCCHVGGRQEQLPPQQPLQRARQEAGVQLVVLTAQVPQLLRLFVQAAAGGASVSARSSSRWQQRVTLMQSR